MFTRSESTSHRCRVMPIDEGVSWTDGIGILTRVIDCEHRFTFDARQFILHSRQNELVAKIAKTIVTQDKHSGHLAPGCRSAIRKHAEHEIEDTPYAPYAAWLDDQSVQPLRAGLLNESRRSADKSTPDIERAAYADCDRDTHVAVLPDPLLLGSSAHADQENVDVRCQDFLDHVCFFCRVKVAGMETGDMKTRVTAHDV